MRRKLVSAAVATTAAATLTPAPAAAHGLVQRADLPIPEWLFGWAAAVVLVVSFVALAVLWSEPVLEEGKDAPGNGTAVGRALASPAVNALCGAIGVALLGVTIWAGFAGVDSPEANFAPTFVFVIFWVGIALASVLFGDFFRAFNPWRAIGRATGALVTRARSGRAPAHRAYPERLGHYPAAAGILAFTLLELVVVNGEQPAKVAGAALAYTAVTLIAMAVYGTERWTERGEAFSVYFGLFARLAPLEARDGAVRTRPPLRGLARFTPLPGTVALLMVAIGTVTFDGLSAGAVWRENLQPELFSVTASEWVTDLVGLLACVGLVSLFYRLGIAGARSVGGGFNAVTLRRRFVHSLVPIALVYVVAHYLTLLVFQGQALAYLASDPLGHGWDLFGTADSAIDFSVLSQNLAWYLQVGFVVAGHVAALVLAHDRALATYSDSRLAVRSQYWMLAVMVGFTTLALWLLAQAGA